MPNDASHHRSPFTNPSLHESDPSNTQADDLEALASRLRDLAPAEWAMLLSQLGKREGS